MPCVVEDNRRVGVVSKHSIQYILSHLAMPCVVEDNRRVGVVSEKDGHQTGEQFSLESVPGSLKDDRHSV